MKLIYFTRDYTPHDYRFLNSLAGTEHEVHFLRLERGPRQMEDRPVPENIRQIVWKGGQRPAQWRDTPALLADLKRVLREVKPDLIHAGPIQRVAFLPALAGYTPLVSMSWGSDLLKESAQNAWWRWVTRFTLRRSAALLGDCEAVKNKAAEFGFPGERVTLFPWGIDLERFAPAPDDGLRERLGWKDAFVLLSLRSWEPIYGVDVVIRAFAAAAAKEPRLRLILLGNGSQAPMVHRLVAERQLEDRIFFGGQVGQADLPRYYRAADLYISASHSDGSSVSLMEALGCGLPVLVSDIPGNLEWITPGAQGWLFPDGDPYALAEGMLAAKDCPDLKEMSAAARALAEKRADWNQNFGMLLKAYQVALQGRRAS